MMLMIVMDLDVKMKIGVLSLCALNIVLSLPGRTYL